MLMQIKYNPEITLGNLLTIVSFISAVFLAYMDLKTTDTEQRAAITATQLQSNNVNDGLKELSKDVRNLDSRVTQYQIDLLQRENKNVKPIR